MLTEGTLTQTLRSLGAEHKRLDHEIQRLEQILDESDNPCPRPPPRCDELSSPTTPDSRAADLSKTS
ncbi:MAG: hypothetical protein O2968_13070 [Acidobacteria bacterium]|nr:hypothetical protein [Acidobacteriota bacterium]